MRTQVPGRLESSPSSTPRDSGDKLAEVLLLGMVRDHADKVAR
jgi:hypothetical protein